MDKKKYWQGVYAEKKPDEVSWYQTRPERSLKMIEAAGLSPADPIIDVGGGASRFVDDLLQLGHASLTVLDISKESLEYARQRLGVLAKRVEWIEADITWFQAKHPYRFWHDRAVFHFLTDAGDRKRYLEVMNRSVAPSGYVMIATFAPDGPEKCSGLPVQRYSHESLQQTLGPDFELMLKDQEAHATPWKTKQHFIYGLFRKVSKNP